MEMSYKNYMCGLVFLFIILGLLWVVWFIRGGLEDYIVIIEFSRFIRLRFVYKVFNVI